MSKHSPIRFEVLRLKNGPETHEITESPAVYELNDDPEYRFEDPVVLEVTLRLVSDTVLMHGTIKTIAQVPCARCLEALRIPLTAPFDLVFMTDNRLLDPEHYPELEGDNTRWYDGEIIYPVEALRELLLLELPSVPACELEPGDICPIRGVKVEPMVFGGGATEADEAERPDSFANQLRRLRKEID